MLRRPNPHLEIHVLLLPACKVKLLGVMFSNRFHFDSNVRFILKICNHRPYRNWGIRDWIWSGQLTIIYNAIIQSQTMNASPAWSGLFELFSLKSLQDYTGVSQADEQVWFPSILSLYTPTNQSRDGVNRAWLCPACNSVKHKMTVNFSQISVQLNSMCNQTF